MGDHEEKGTAQAFALFTDTNYTNYCCGLPLFRLKVVP
jgi:hypothetical protein